LPEVPEVLDMVVSPKIGKAFIEEAAVLGIKNIWLQPGTCNQEILELIKEKHLVGLQSCVLAALSDI